MKLYAFNITNFKVDGGAMFGVVPKLIWSNVIPADENNLIPLALRSLVVEHQGRIVLIDNGIGSKQDQKFLNQLQLSGGIGLQKGLEEGGYHPEDISDVILTHLHFDHCGGSIYRNESGQLLPVFSNARYWVSRLQWENALNPNSREADAFLSENILPLESTGVLHLVEEAGMLMEGIELRMAHGHTPGQLIPVIQVGAKRLIYGADLFPTHAHIPVKYNMAYDLDVTTTLLEKELLLSELAGSEDVILFEHDTQIECATVVLSNNKYRTGKRFNLNEWLSLP